MDNIQEAIKDIDELEYEGDGDSADRSPQHSLPWDMEDSGGAPDSKEELLQEEAVTQQEVGMHPPCPKRVSRGATSTHKIRNASQYDIICRGVYHTSQ